jgi:hypothetical protein
LVRGPGGKEISSDDIRQEILRCKKEIYNGELGKETPKLKELRGMSENILKLFQVPEHIYPSQPLSKWSVIQRAILRKIPESPKLHSGFIVSRSRESKSPLPWEILRLEGRGSLKVRKMRDWEGGYLRPPRLSLCVL